jgi:THUMP domain-containing protein
VAGMSVEPCLEDYAWLVGSEAAGCLDELAADRQSLLTRIARLRRVHSAARAHLLVQQVELRERARDKFPRAEAMFFTPLGLQQATDWWVAAYKAGRFPAGPVFDLCCGIGGDLLGLAARGPSRLSLVVGVDRDPIAACLAEANARACLAAGPAGEPTRVLVADVLSAPVEDAAAWHLDPDRRPQGRRTTRPELHEPGLDVMETLLTRQPAGAIKLAPAAVCPDAWTSRAELEWISRGGECRQLVAWFGSLARYPGQRSATMVAPAGGAVRTIIGTPQPPLEAASRVGRYVFDVNPAVLAAGLQGVLAADHGLMPLAAGIAYLTGDAPVVDPALDVFEVLEVVPYQEKRLKSLLHARGIGRVEVKKRGVALAPEQVQRALRGPGSECATLLLAPLASGITAIIARRIPRGGAGD